jgi:hypothetical protein
VDSAFSPNTMNAVLSGLTAVVGTLSLLLYRALDRRLGTLEETSESKETANGHRTSLKEDLAAHNEQDERQFLSLQTALHEFRIETRERFVHLGAEANEKRTEVRNDLINYRAETSGQLNRLYDLIQSQGKPTRRR